MTEYIILAAMRKLQKSIEIDLLTFGSLCIFARIDTSCPLAFPLEITSVFLASSTTFMGLIVFANSDALAEGLNNIE